MKIAVIGGGGREHAIIKKLKENKQITELFCLPGNGGISFDAQCVDIKANEVDTIAQWAADNKIDYVVVAPDDPLVLGLVDKLEKLGIKAFGPNEAAAIIEGSKVFSKSLMKKYNIPTAQYEVFDDADKAAKYLEKEAHFPIVLKADGLALGKGVLICGNLIEAIGGVKTIMCDKMFGSAGNSLVIEEFLTGPEVSVLCFTDGKTMVPMVSSMDHKRALDKDEGLNTGGMGTISPNPFYTSVIAEECMKNIFLPTMQAMNTEGRAFKGCLYFGLMLTPNGVKVIEYNCRFGDPETQVVLPLLKTDLYEVMLAVTEERLSEIKVEFREGAAACVVMASGGYPQSYNKGCTISGLVNGDIDGATVYHAGTMLDKGNLQTSGGRVMGVTATGDNLKQAVAKAYEAVNKISFNGAFYRRDIGTRALNEINKEG